MSRHKCRFRFEIKIHIGYILKATDIRTLVSNAIGILKVYPTNTYASHLLQRCIDVKKKYLTKP